MTRADWLNLLQVAVFGLQSLNALLVMWHGNVYITGIILVIFQSASMYLHLMGIKTDPVTGQAPEPPAK